MRLSSCFGMRCPLFKKCRVHFIRGSEQLSTNTGLVSHPKHTLIFEPLSLLYNKQNKIVIFT